MPALNLGYNEAVELTAVSPKITKITGQANFIAGKCKFYTLSDV